MQLHRLELDLDGQAFQELVNGNVLAVAGYLDAAFDSALAIILLL